MKYLFEIILEDELYEIKRDNRVKESLIQIANDEISNLAKENQYKVTTIQKCNQEILKEIKANMELLKEKKALTIDLDETQTYLKAEEQKTMALAKKATQLEADLKMTEANLIKEKEEKDKLVIANKKLQATFAHLTQQAEKFEVNENFFFFKKSLFNFFLDFK